jgi:pyruvate,water dikinase
MKPLLMLEDVISGKVTEEEFMRICGQRAVNEMEFSEKHPYEIENYVQQAIEDYRTQGVSAHELKAKSEADFSKALDAFVKANPSKAKKVKKLIGKFARSNAFREDFRAKGVWSLCVMREWLLGVGRANGLGDDVFMLYIKEAIELTKGDTSVLSKIPARKANYERYLSNPPFPNVIIGRFEPSEWLSDPDRRNDFYRSGAEVSLSDSAIKGFPGAAGKVTGMVRVIDSIDKIDEVVPGEILVTNATNIGWTRIFPKVSAIVTDIGAPLSHAAIVAREFGIPAVVGCGNATTVLKTGDLVEVDGTAGTVTIKND